MHSLLKLFVLFRFSTVCFLLWLADAKKAIEKQKGNQFENIYTLSPSIFSVPSRGEAGGGKVFHSLQIRTVHNQENHDYGRLKVNLFYLFIQNYLYQG